MTWNECIVMYSTSLPDIQFYNVSYLISNVSLVADIADFFKRVSYSYETAITQQILYYMDDTGKPCISSQDDYKTDPVPFIYTHQTYGQNDSPIASQIALMMGIDQYEKYSRFHILPIIKSELEHWIKRTYVDDFGIFPTLDRVVDFMSKLPIMMSGLHCMHENCPNGLSPSTNADINNCRCPHPKKSLCLCCHRSRSRLDVYRYLLEDITENPRFGERAHVLSDNCKLCEAPMFHADSINLTYSIVPLGCCKLKNTCYVQGTPNSFNIGIYLQELDGYENVVCTLSGGPKQGLRQLIDLSQDPHFSVSRYVIKELSKLSNITYTLLGQALTRHYILIVIYFIQQITFFNNFFFKNLESSDSILDDILPYFLVTDIELANVKNNLKHLRPTSDQIFKEILPGFQPNDPLIVKDETIQPDIPSYEMHNLPYEPRVPIMQLTSLVTIEDNCKYCEQNNIHIASMTISQEHEILSYYNDVFQDITDYRYNFPKFYNVTNLNKPNTKPNKPATQLGRSFHPFDSSQTLSKPHHIFGNLGLGDRHRTIKLVGGRNHQLICCSTYDEALAILQSSPYVFTKRTFLKLLSQLFDMAGQFHIALSMLSKFWWHGVCQDPRITSWESPLDNRYVHYATIFIQYFFISSKKQIPRSPVLSHPNSKRTILTCCDAGDTLYGFVVFLISQLFDDQGHVIEHDCTVLVKSSLTMPKLWTIPQAELLALSKSCFVTVKLLAHLQSEGLNIHKQNIIFCSDSNIAISQSRYVGSEKFSQKRVSALVSKLQMLFVDQQLCLIKQIRFWNQAMAPFPADFITKFPVPTEKLKPKHLEQITQGSQYINPIHLNTNLDDWDFLTIKFNAVNLQDMGLIPHLVQNKKDIKDFALCVTVTKDNERPFGDMTKWLHQLEQFFAQNLMSTTGEYLYSTSLRLSEKYYERFCISYYWGLHLKFKTLHSKHSKILRQRVTNVLKAIEEKNEKCNDKTMALEVLHKNWLMGITQIAPTYNDISNTLATSIQQLQIPSDCHVIRYHDWTFSVPFALHDWADVLMKTVYMILVEYLYFLSFVQQGSLDKIKPVLYRYLNFYFLTHLDKVKPWDLALWSKTGRCFQPIIIEKQDYWLDNGVLNSKTFFRVQVMISREQRHLLDPDQILGPIYKLFTPLNQGSFSNFICKTIHQLSHLGSTKEHECLLLNRGFWVQRPHSIFTHLKNNCASCQIKKAVSMSDRYLSEKLNKSGTLDIYSFLETPGLYLNSRYSVLDLTGPFLIKWYGTRQKLKVWICLYLDLRSHILTLSPICSLSSEALVCNINSYCSAKNGIIFITDAGSNFTGAAGELNVKNMEVNSDSLSLETIQQSQRLLEIDDISLLLVSSKNHEAVGRVESFVWQVKRVFAETSVTLQLREGNFHFDQFNFILQKTAAIINSRPLLISKHGSVITPLTTQALSQCNPYLLERNLTCPDGLSKIISNINSAIFQHMFQQNICETRLNYRLRISKSGVHTFKPGDVVFDPYTFKKCKNYTSSLYLITYVNKSQTWVLMRRPRSTINLTKQYKHKYGVAPKATTKLHQNPQYLHCLRHQIIISRAIKSIYHIAYKNNNTDLVFEKSFLEDFMTTELIEKYLSRQNDVYHLFNFTHNNIKMDLDFFKNLSINLHHTLEIPNKKFENISKLSEKEATLILKSLFESETAMDDAAGTTPTVTVSDDNTTHPIPILLHDKGDDLMMDTNYEDDLADFNQQSRPRRTVRKPTWYKPT